MLHKATKLCVFEAADTKWAAPIVFAPRKDGAWRLCVEYWNPNAVSIGDAYPLPQMDECIALLRAAKFFSTLDAN